MTLSPYTPLSIIPMPETSHPPPAEKGKILPGAVELPQFKIYDRPPRECLCVPPPNHRGQHLQSSSDQSVVWGSLWTKPGHCHNGGYHYLLQTVLFSGTSCFSVKDLTPLPWKCKYKYHDFFPWQKQRMRLNLRPNRACWPESTKRIEESCLFEGDSEGNGK